MAISFTSGHIGWTGQNTGTPFATYYGQIAAVDEFVALSKFFTWSSLEPTQNNYNFSAVGDALDYLAAQGGTKKLLISLSWRKFSGTTAAGFLPAYLGGEGIGYDLTSNGVIARIYDKVIGSSVVYNRWIALLTALASYLSAHANKSLVHAIGFEETALGLNNSPNGMPPGLNSTNWQQTVLDFDTEARSIFADNVVWQRANSSLNSVSGMVESLVALGDMAVGDTDMWPYGGTHTQTVAMAARASEIRIMHVVSQAVLTYTATVPDDYPNPIYAGRTLSYAANGQEYFDYLIDYAVRIGKCETLLWNMNGAAGTMTDIIAAVQDAGPDGSNIFPPDIFGETEPPIVEPPQSVTGFTFKSAQGTLLTTGSALAVPHSLPAIPKLVLAFGNRAIANDSGAGVGNFFIGASDLGGTPAQWVVSGRANTSVNPSQSGIGGKTDHTLWMINAGSTSVDGTATIAAPDDTSINFTVDDTFANANLFTVVAAAGEGISRYVGTKQLSTQDAAVTVDPTDPTSAAGFVPNAGIVVSIPTAFSGTVANDLRVSIGIFAVDANSNLHQKSYSFVYRDGVTPSEAYAELFSTKVGGLLTAAGALSHSVEVALTGTGISLTARDGDGSGTYCGLLLMKLNGVDQDVVDITFPKTGEPTAGLYSHTIGGPMEFGLLVGALIESLDSISTNQNAGGLFISANTPVVSNLAEQTYRDNNATTTTNSRAAQRMVHLHDHIGTTEQLKAAFSSQTAGDLTLNYATVPATNKLGFLWRVSATGLLSIDSESAGAPVTIDLTPYTDYIRLGATAVTDVYRKATGGGQITVAGDAPQGRFGGNSTSYSAFTATDAAPVGAFAASPARVTWLIADDEIIIQAPAGVNSSEMSFWIAASGVDIDIAANVSDGSSSEQTLQLTSADTTTGNIDARKVTVSFAALQDGETITITATLSAINAANGNMSLSAVALTNNYVPPSDTQPPEWILGFPSAANITNSSFDVSVLLNEEGTVVGQVRKITNLYAPNTYAQIEAGTDGTDDDTDIVSATSVDVDFNAAGILSFSGLSEGTQYYVDLCAKDAIGNAQDVVLTLLVTTASAGGGGGEGAYSVTIELDNGAGSLAVDTEVIYAWVESVDFDTPQDFSGSWARATSGPTGLLTVQRPVDSSGHLIVRGENGEIYHTRELTPA